MNKTQNNVFCIASASLFLAAFLFFSILYSGHLHNQEQFQLFLFTGEYLKDLVTVPGGVAVWISRFFTQFYYYGVCGGLLCAVFIWASHRLCAAASTDDTFFSRTISFIPAFVLWGSMCKTYSLLVPAVSIVMCLAAVHFCSKAGENVRAVLFPLLVPVLFWLAGPAAIILVFASPRTGKWWSVALCVALFAVFPFAVRPFVPVSIHHLYCGSIYYKDPEMFPVLQWVAIAMFSLYSLIFSFRKFNVPVNVTYSVLAVSFVAMALTLKLFPDYDYEEELQYNHLARLEKWDRIIKKSEKKKPMNVMSLSCVNAALAYRGRLGDDMFKYAQTGVNSLIPSYTKTHNDNVYISDAYYHIGMISASQNSMFESKEAIPDMQKGSRAYQRLAQTNSINGQYAVSGKYLDALSHTLFYRKWAKDFNHDSPEMKRMREWNFHQRDFLLSYDNMINQLGALYEENNDNYMAYQYVVAWALLQKDLEWFKKLTGLRSFSVVPRHYQEAYLLIWMSTHDSFDGMPSFISTSVLNRFKKFIDAANGKQSVESMYKNFSDTYWMYFYFDVTK